MRINEEQKNRDARGFAERINCVSGAGQQAAEQCAAADPISGSAYAGALREKIRGYDIAICELEAGGWVGVRPAVHVLQGARDRYRNELKVYEESCVQAAKRTAEAHRELEQARKDFAAWQEREREARPRTITIRTIRERTDLVEGHDVDGNLLWWLQGPARDCRAKAQKERRPQDKIRDETDDGAKCAIPDVLGASKPGAQSRAFRANPDFGGV